MKQTKGLKRNTIDKFYTKNSAVLFCMEHIKKHVNIARHDLIIEPSAGNGAFINTIKHLSNNYRFYDIKPENDEIVKQDYLTLNTKLANKTIHIIGNPPFGRQSSLALKFMKKSTSFSNTVSFILPKSFKKNSLKNKIDLNFHCVCEVDLPENSFTINNDDYNVPCVFQIWVKKTEKRKLPKKLEPKHFRFVKKEQDHDISFRRVGVYAGKIDTETNEKSFQSHYFIKFDEGVFNHELLDKLKNIIFKECNDTVGPKSTSKQELIKEFNIILNQ
tara:strand:+ start:1594 stop:2415 length:822 start_codon:yes stop_codon:yes gene_type:complete